MHQARAKACASDVMAAPTLLTLPRSCPPPPTAAQLADGDDSAGPVRPHLALARVERARQPPARCRRARHQVHAIAFPRHGVKRADGQPARNQGERWPMLGAPPCPASVRGALACCAWLSPRRCGHWGRFKATMSHPRTPPQAWDQMVSMILGGNRFEGELPDDIYHMQLLTFLDISNNRRGGREPGADGGARGAALPAQLGIGGRHPQKRGRLSALQPGGMQVLPGRRRPTSHSPAYPGTPPAGSTASWTTASASWST